MRNPGTITLLKATAALALLLTAWSCSSSQRRESDGEGRSELHRVSRVLLRNLHARRPQGPGADPNVTPGGPDYRGTPPPDSTLDCKPIGELFADIKLAPMRACLKQIPDGVQLKYRVRFRAMPLLELESAQNLAGDEFKELAPCVHQTMGRISVPREIFFQSAELGALECYSSRLQVESERFLGAPWPLVRTHVAIQFPLEVTPDDDARTLALLQTWALTPFFGADSGKISARSVPDALCKACIGEENLFTSDRPIPPHWPEGADEQWITGNDEPPPPPPLSP